VTLVSGPQDGATAVTVWSLEMTDPAELRPKHLPLESTLQPLLLLAGRPAPELSELFYRLVGRPWQWVDRVGWGRREWLDWVQRPGHRLTTCWVDGVPAGYFELLSEGHDVEVAYFGLVDGFHGQGLGGWLLTNALSTAWEMPSARRVWVHTCSLDGPAALRNYEARGLRRFREDVEWRICSHPS
jgi:GNAT superfamily N-acetyltransferase